MSIQTNSIKTIFAISGSLRTESTNGAVLRAIARLAPAGATVVIYDGLAILPHFTRTRYRHPTCVGY